MLIECNRDRLESCKAYIAGAYEKALYLYIDLMHYGCDTPQVQVFLTERNGRQNGLFLRYYDCLHCFSREEDLDPNETMELIERLSPRTIFMSRGFYAALPIEKLASYELHSVELFCAVPYRTEESVPLAQAEAKDAAEIADFLLTLEGYRKVYTRELLQRQLRERMEQGFGRSFVVRGTDGKLLFHACTVAEARPLAIAGLVLLDESLRGKGQGKRYFSSVFNRLLGEGFTVYSNNLDERARHIHKALGYTEQCGMIKLTKKDV